MKRSPSWSSNTAEPSTTRQKFDHQIFDCGSTIFRYGADLQRLWAEHGHQADPSNHDEDPRLGHALTQAAFLDPNIRSAEGPVTWALWKAKRGGIARTEGIKHAMQRCLLDHITSSQPCRGIYVMGHTHEAMLKRVELMPWPPQKKAKG